MGFIIIIVKEKSHTEKPKVLNSMVATAGMIGLEGYTDQNDNLHVPTFYLALYLILEKVNPVR